MYTFLAIYHRFVFCAWCVTHFRFQTEYSSSLLSLLFFFFFHLWLIFLLLFLVSFHSSFHSKTGYQTQNTVQKLNIFSVVNSDPELGSSWRVHNVALYHSRLNFRYRIHCLTWLLGFPTFRPLAFHKHVNFVYCHAFLPPVYMLFPI